MYNEGINSQQQGTGLHTFLKQAKTRGTPSLGPSVSGMKSIIGPVQLKGLTTVNSKSFSKSSAGGNSKHPLLGEEIKC